MFLLRLDHDTSRGPFYDPLFHIHTVITWTGERERREPRESTQSHCQRMSVQLRLKTTNPLNPISKKFTQPWRNRSILGPRIKSAYFSGARVTKNEFRNDTNFFSCSFRLALHTHQLCLPSFRPEHRDKNKQDATELRLRSRDAIRFPFLTSRFSL